MRVKRTEKVLTMRDAPVGFWTLGGLFLSVGTIFLCGVFINSHELSWRAISLIVGMSLIAVSTGFWLIFAHPFVSIVLNRETRTIIVSRSYLFRRSIGEYRFDDVRQFAIEEGENDGSPIWRIELQLKNNFVVQLSVNWMSRQQECLNVKFLADEFVRRRLK